MALNSIHQFFFKSDNHFPLGALEEYEQSRFILHEFDRLVKCPGPMLRWVHTTDDQHHFWYELKNISFG